MPWGGPEANSARDGPLFLTLMTALSFTTQSTVNSVAFNWQWSAAAYSFWPDNTQAGILAYHQSLHAGSPVNTQVQQSLIQGPRGGGGSNYTGSWSGTGHGACPGAN
jgi:hypothetical protein